MTALKIALCLPPVWYYLHPPVEIAYVAAYLRAKGYAPSVRDLNVEFFDRVLDQKRLQAAYECVQSEWQTLDAQAHLGLEQQARYAELTPIVLKAPYVIERVAWAKAVLRDPVQFYVYDDYTLACQVLQQGCALISMQYAPTLVHLYGYKTAYDARSLTQVQQAIQDTQSNLFLDILLADWLDEYLAADLDVLGLNVIHPDQIIPALTFAHTYKRRGGKAHITVFGHLEDQFNFTHVLECLKVERASELFALVDSLILQESEEPLLRLVEALEAGRPLAEVPNLVYLDAGQVRFTPVGLPPPIRTLAGPDYCGLPFEKYFFPEPVIDYMASRGCYWDICTFCAIDAFHQGYRVRNVDTMLDDLEQIIAQTGARFFRFRDQIFSPAYLARLAEGILQRNLKIVWNCRARFESGFTEAVLTRLHAAGCHVIWFGFESAAPRVLEFIKKGTPIELIETVIERCYRTGVRARLLTMVGQPTETEAEAYVTRDFLLRYRDKIDGYNYGYFMLFRQSEFGQNLAKYGLTTSYPDDGILSYQLDYMPQAGLTPAQILALHAQIRQELYAGMDLGRFVDLTHRYLYQQHYGSDFARVTAETERGTPLDEARVAECAPVVPRQIYHARLHFSYAALCARRGNGPGAAHGALEVLPAGDYLLVMDVTTGKIWQLEAHSEFFLAQATGQHTVKQIAELASREFNLTLEQALKTSVSFFAAGHARQIVDLVLN